MLIAERRELFDADGVKWFGEDTVRALDPDIQIWFPDRAEAMFMVAVSECLKAEAV